MVIYTCEKCNKMFNKKSGYVMHTEHKKKPCIGNIEIITPKYTKSLKITPKYTKSLKNTPICTESLKITTICTESLNFKSQNEVFIVNGDNGNSTNCYMDSKIFDTIIICTYCDKNFTRHFSLKRHIERCKIKNIKEYEIENELKDEINILKIKNEEIEKLKNEEIEKLKNEVKMLNNNIVNNKPIININNNIQINIVNYGEEDLKKIDLKKILKYDNAFIEMVFRDIHCNRELPEYQNILLPSLSRYEIYIKLNNEWLKRNKKEILKERYLTIRDYIMELYTEESEKNKNKAEQIYYHFLKQIKLVDPTNTIYRPEEEKKIIDGIANVLYNHKNNIKSIDKTPLLTSK